jgi:endonuclease YncB( thermonuclease family)
MPGRRRPRGLWVGMVLALLVVALLRLLQPVPPPLSGRGTVVDGDTLRLGGERVRLLNLDAPERAQICTDAAGAQWACGEAARSYLRRLLASGDITCTPTGRDRYERLLARCSGAGSDLGGQVVGAGLAVPDGGYGAEAAAARAAKAGIWAGPFTAPAQWRRDEGQGGGGVLATIRGWFGS